MTGNIQPPQRPERANRPAPPRPPDLPTPAQEPATQPDFNAQQDVEVRPCGNCGGQFEFNISLQKLECPDCGTHEEIVHHHDASVEEQAYGMLALKRREPTHLEGEKEVICQNCGGHTTFVGSTTATRCPYCATPIQRSDIHEAPDRLAVDGVLPFQLDDSQAQELLRTWISKRWYAPNEFKKYSTEGSFKSVYAAYFTYDANASTTYQGSRGVTRMVTRGSGNNRRTTTETSWYPARGTVLDSFDDITILANTGFEKKFVDRLEPWPTAQVQPYHSDYIAGHLCRTYDREVTHCFKEAKQHMDNQIDSTIRRDIGGDKQRIHHKNTRLTGVTYKHLLLPIWLLTVLYEGQPWQVFVNGATGEIHGERPFSKVKIAATVVAVIALIVLIVILRNVFGS